MKASLRKCQNWTFMHLSGVTSNISAVRFGAFRAPARVTFGRCSKSDQKNSLNLRFKNPRMLCSVYNLVPCTARSQNIVGIAAHDESSFFSRRCRSCNSTMGAVALLATACGHTTLRDRTYCRPASSSTLWTTCAVLWPTPGAAVRSSEVSSGSFSAADSARR